MRKNYLFAYVVLQVLFVNVAKANILWKYDCLARPNESAVLEQPEYSKVSYRDLKIDLRISLLTGNFLTASIRFVGNFQHVSKQPTRIIFAEVKGNKYRIIGIMRDHRGNKKGKNWSLIYDPTKDMENPAEDRWIFNGVADVITAKSIRFGCTNVGKAPFFSTKPMPDITLDQFEQIEGEFSGTTVYLLLPDGRFMTMKGKKMVLAEGRAINQMKLNEYLKSTYPELLTIARTLNTVNEAEEKKTAPVDKVALKRQTNFCSFDLQGKPRTIEWALIKKDAPEKTVKGLYIRYDGSLEWVKPAVTAGIPSSLEAEPNATASGPTEYNFEYPDSMYENTNGDNSSYHIKIQVSGDKAEVISVKKSPEGKEMGKTPIVSTCRPLMPITQTTTKDSEILD